MLRRYLGAWVGAKQPLPADAGAILDLTCELPLRPKHRSVLPSVCRSCRCRHDRWHDSIWVCCACGSSSELSFDDVLCLRFRSLPYNNNARCWDTQGELQIDESCLLCSYIVRSNEVSPAAKIPC